MLKEFYDENNELIASVIGAEFRKEGVAFFTPGDFSQQLGTCTTEPVQSSGPTHTTGLDIQTHIVHVDFTVLRIKGDRVLNRVNETHDMRFFFPKDLEFMITTAGYQVLGMHPFMSLERALTERDWTMTAIAKNVLE